MSGTSFDMDDDAFLAWLQGIVATEDPVPAAVLDFAKLAPSLVSMDLGLAELVEERELEGVRDVAATSFRYRFEGCELAVDITDGMVVGRLSEPGWCVEVQEDDVRRELSVDDGVFVCAPTTSRFLLVADDGRRSFTTDWLRAFR